MCMVSAVYDYGRTIPIKQWTPDTWDRFQEILDRIKDLDDKLDQPDCHDPAKAEWMRSVEERLRRLEHAESKQDRGRGNQPLGQG